MPDDATGGTIRWVLVRRDLASGKSWELLTKVGGPGGLAVSPNGRAVAAVRDGAILVIPADGGSARTVAPPLQPPARFAAGHAGVLDWTPDSTGSGQGAFSDDGRFLVTGEEKDRGAFKTPTLREVARTAPYMHDGSLATLDAVVDFYDGGGRPNPNLDPEIRPLHLSADDRRALVAFLRALSGDVVSGVSGAR